MDKIVKYRVMESSVMLIHPTEYDTAAAAQHALDDESNLDLETEATCYQVVRMEYDDPKSVRAAWDASAADRRVLATPTPDLERQIAEAKALLASVEAHGGIEKIVEERESQSISADEVGDVKEVLGE